MLFCCFWTYFKLALLRKKIPSLQPFTLTARRTWQRSLWCLSHNSHTDLLQSWLAQSRSREPVLLLHVKKKGKMNKCAKRAINEKRKKMKISRCSCVRGPWHGLARCPTWSPQGDALLLVSLADAVVAVALHIVAGVSIVQINVGRAVRVGARAELWQVAGVAGLATKRSGQLQLRTQTGDRAS